MEQSVGQTLQKIKQQEQNNEIKLREKRELNNAIMSLNRAIRETLSHIGKLSKEYQNLIEVTDKLSSQLEVEKTRHSALIEQLTSCCKELEELRNATNDGVSTVWNKRSKLLETTHGIADKCDIWALLIKPICNEMVPCVKYVEDKKEGIRHDEKLKTAIERRNKILAERNYLLREPETGEEFIRIKNALQYSMEFAEKSK